MNNSHRLLFIVYYFEDPHSFVDKLSSVTFFLLISSRALLIYLLILVLIQFVRPKATARVKRQSE